MINLFIVSQIFMYMIHKRARGEYRSWILRGIKRYIILKNFML